MQPRAKPMLVPALAPLLLAVLGAGSALAQDQPKPGDKDKEKQGQDKDEKGDEESGEALRGKFADITRRVYGTDRDARTKALWDALGLGVKIGEDFWLKLLETRFPTADEDEEAMFFAAYGLRFIGTARSLPALEKLADREPEVRVFNEEMKGYMAKYGYQGWAVQAIDAINVEIALTTAEERTKTLGAVERADTLVGWFLDLDASYKLVRPKKAPEKTPVRWEGWLERRIAEFGAEGARALARAIDKTDDHEKRAKLAGELVEFSGDSIYNKDGCPEGRLVVQQQRGSEYVSRVERNRADPGVRAAVIAAVRTVLAGRPRRYEASALHATKYLHLTELEPDLIAYIQRVEADPTQLNAQLKEYGVLQHETFIGQAVNTLAWIGSDAALNFIDSHPRISPYYGIRLDWFVPRWAAAAEHEPPEEVEGFIRRLGGVDAAPYVEQATLQRILGRLRAALPTAPAQKGVKKSIEENIALCERVIAELPQMKINAEAERQKKEREREKFEKLEELGRAPRGEHRGNAEKGGGR